MISLDRRKISFDFLKTCIQTSVTTIIINFANEIVQCAFSLSLQHDFSWLEES